MASEHVLRISRTDSPGDYILLNTTNDSSKQEDLQLLATEGSEPYTKILKKSRIPRYRAKSNHLTDAQWDDVLRSTLLQTRPPTPIKSEDQDTVDQDPFQNLELVASISDSKLTLTFRKSISGIHQKLGELALPKDPSAGISLFDWVLALGAHAETARAEATNLQHQVAAQTETVQQLNAQLDELIQAKKEHEDLLLQKCAVLINEKKKKIREQQRLLNTAKVNTRTFKQVQKDAQQAVARQHRSPEPSRTGKRKASVPAASSDEDDGFEDQDAKVEEAAPEEEPDSEQATPQHSDLDETEDEADRDDLESVPAPATAKGMVMEHGKVNDGLGETRDIQAASAELPPRRELPFGKGDAQKESETTMEGDQDMKMADDDDETDDDEL